ncbi:MAG: L-gulono,4-lactone dehydrogenase [Cryptosporangiaceae bacterium]|nr:L-gulono,4-lactone dehydrogenase [Cryptosporangiaceae bacterium]
MSTSWVNWGRNQRCRPMSVCSPSTVDELAATVKSAAEAGRRVKPVGAGHSFTAIAATDGVQLRLDKLSGIVAAEPQSGLVTLFAGTCLRDVPGLLAPYGLAMENLGDIDAQTIAGAVSTGTHGTGLRYGGIAAQIRALSLVLADGSLVDCSPTERPDLYGAARVGLGALGVLATVTLQCVPAFRLRAVERPVPYEEMLGTFEERYSAFDHVEFYWFPHTDWTLYKEDTRLPGTEPVSPPGAIRSYIDDELLSNTAFEALCRLGHRVPSVIPHTAGIAARALSAREYVDVSHAVLTSDRRVRFREMEYAVPREAICDVIREVRAVIERRGFRISFPIEIRVAAADDIWLSTASGRETAYIAIHQYWRTPFGDYFAAAEEIFKAVGGRPHWGKLHTLDAADLAGRYPHFADFQQLRASLDPDGVFRNDYLDAVLGLPG